MSLVIFFFASWFVCLYVCLFHWRLFWASMIAHRNLILNIKKVLEGKWFIVIEFQFCFSYSPYFLLLLSRVTHAQTNTLHIFTRRLKWSLLFFFLFSLIYWRFEYFLLYSVYPYPLHNRDYLFGVTSRLFSKDFHTTTAITSTTTTTTTTTIPTPSFFFFHFYFFFHFPFSFIFFCLYLQEC